MNNSLLLVLVLTISFLCLVEESMSQAYGIRNTEHPDYPNHCYHLDPYTNDTIILKRGQKRRRSRHCHSVDCSQDYTLTVAGCGIPGGIIHCRVIKGDLSKPYPYCCDEYIC